MMRHYSTSEFFRQMPNALLARFFHEHGFFKTLDFAAMHETKPNALFTAWLALSAEDRKNMDALLQEICDLSCEKGFKAIIDEASWQMQDDPAKLTDFVDSLSALPNHYHRAMITFLDYNECWNGATKFYHADSLNYWRKRKQMGHKPAAIDDGSVKQLADLIRNYFHNTEGRGNNCVVELFKRGDLDYFFAYPEDYSQQSVEWVDGEFDRRPHNPAFEIVFVYSQQDGTLDLNFRGTYKAVDPLQQMFAYAILKMEELPPEQDDNRVYDLNAMRYKNFSFNYPVGSGIEHVAIKKIRLSSRITAGDRITVEADASDDQLAVYDQFERISTAVRLDLYNVTQVEITSRVVADVNKPAKTVNIRITHPNSCSLKYDAVDLKLRCMLELSGIELKEQLEEVEFPETAEV